ncbi:BolA/IbaG family iron-sulfur metabolism protein [Nitrosomonas sp.]|uniref:BolA family protein n=1 Tax=Nitrosomonas sp. TaxID=42353 RepID=UPI0025CBE34A|nr:BolA/IbaG family iron-sulfur metabolism protein [Nitrosomonas sp.]MCC6916261.1 BolA/IbaG family iron-sulfur metabolism protein [Nitrosomonas sp.]
MPDMKNKIESRLQSLQPQFLEVINESYRHNVPAGSESHFKVTIVSDVFSGKPLVARHRLVNTTLTDEIVRSIHALALHTLTPAEWRERNETAHTSPPCLGGSPGEIRAGAKKVC